MPLQRMIINKCHKNKTNRITNNRNHLFICRVKSLKSSSQNNNALKVKEMKRRNWFLKLNAEIFKEYLFFAQFAKTSSSTQLLLIASIRFVNFALQNICFLLTSVLSVSFAFETKKSATIFSSIIWWLTMLENMSPMITKITKAAWRIIKTLRKTKRNL